MNKHWRYLTYVTRHKWYVFVACLHLGIPWRGFIHDWSKFLPCEWFPYVRKFYGGPYRSWTLRWDPYVHGLAPFQEEVDAAFDCAWLHHQHYNKHHWQHWVLRNDDGDTRILQMPWKYVDEMIADWRGAGKALGKPDTGAWYMHNRERILLHPDVRRYVEWKLGVVDDVMALRLVA